jgi:hypothetical protein
LLAPTELLGVPATLEDVTNTGDKTPRWKEHHHEHHPYCRQVAFVQNRPRQPRKVSGGTIVRIETDADGHAAYETHVLKADGTAATVYVDKDFNFVILETR